MMTELRRKHDGVFKARVVLEAIRGQRTIAEIAHEYGVHPNQITMWKKKLMDELPRIFSKDSANKEKTYEQEKELLLKKIGRLEMKRDWLQKKLNTFPLKMEDSLALSRQCKLMNFYRHKPESAINLELMRLIDEQYIRYSQDDPLFPPEADLPEA